jgi:hypothetical protein
MAWGRPALQRTPSAGVLTMSTGSARYNFLTPAYADH